MEVSAVHNNFSRQKSLKPLPLLGHYSSLRIPHYIHEGLTEAFEAIIYINRMASQ